MINSSKNSRGFITLTITLIIIILVTILSLMTGRMLMNEQRSNSNSLRYKEAASSAQAGIDAALTRLSLNNDFRGDFSNTTGSFYQVSFGTDSEIEAGEGTLPVVSIVSVGTSGYSPGSNNSDDAESKVTIQQKAVIGNILSGTPDSPLTVAAAMTAGGSFNVVANPNGGGPGVPLSIWSAETVNMSGNINTCALQGVTFDSNGNATSVCNANLYSEKDNKNSDILDDDPNFPSNLLLYMFGVKDLEAFLAKYYTDKDILPNCNSITSASTGVFVVDGDCTLGDAGTADAPVVILVVNADLTINSNADVYGIVYAYSDGTSVPEIKANGTANLYGALVADEDVNVNIANGSFSAIYDADVLNKIETGSQFSYIARISGSWLDRE